MLSTKNAASIVEAALPSKKADNMVKVKLVQGTRIAGEHFSAGQTCMIEDNDFAEFLIKSGKAEIQKEEKKRGRPPKVDKEND